MSTDEPEAKKKKYPTVKQLIVFWEESLTVFELSGLRHRYETDPKVFYRSALALIADLGEPHRDPQMYLNCQDIYKEVERVTPRIVSGAKIYSHVAQRHTMHCLYCGESFQTVKGRLCSARCNRYFKLSKLAQSLGVKQLSNAFNEHQRVLSGILATPGEALSDTPKTEPTLGLTLDSAKESSLEALAAGLVAGPNSN